MTIMNERKVIKNTKFSLRYFTFNLNYSMNHEGCNCGLEFLEFNRTFVMIMKPNYSLGPYNQCATNTPIFPKDKVVLCG